MAAELSKAELEQYVKLDKERVELNRQVDAIERQQKPLKEKLRSHVEAHGGSDRTTTRFGFVLRLLARAGTVKWKDHFIQAQGIDAATKLLEAAPPTLILQVEPAAS